MSGTGPAPPPPAPGPGQASVPEGLVPAVVELVETGPVMLGSYTVAELTAVDAIIDFLETRPGDDVLAEAVRSLAARQLLLAGSAEGQIQVRGDLGIAVVLQQRARTVLDARVTGTERAEPWRILLLPQPEAICLLVRIDALGVHELGLYTLDDAIDRLVDWLPRGSRTDPEDAADPEAVLTAAERSALVTVTRYTAEGSAETAEESTDLVLARQDGRLYRFTRALEDRARLTPAPQQNQDVRDALIALLAAR